MRGQKLRRLDVDETDIMKSKDINGERTARQALYNPLTKLELNDFKKVSLLFVLSEKWILRKIYYYRRCHKH